MENSGEQLIPNISSSRLQEEHRERYKFAKQFCRGKAVLDIACGTGYGSYELSREADRVVGIDISEESICFAQDKYKRENLSFLRADCTKVYLKKNYFDVVVSFETIEHLNEEQRTMFYQHLCDTLKDDGVLVFSTPNKTITSPYTEKPLNLFHILEFTRASLQKELEKFFAVKGWYGQRFAPKILTYKLARKLIRLTELLLGRDFGFYSTFYSSAVSKWGDTYEPRVMVVVLKKK